LSKSGRKEAEKHCMATYKAKNYVMQFLQHFFINKANKYCKRTNNNLFKIAELNVISVYWDICIDKTGIV
jgi:hypothetical protein